MADGFVQPARGSTLEASTEASLAPADDTSIHWPPAYRKEHEMYADNNRFGPGRIYALVFGLAYLGVSLTELLMRDQTVAAGGTTLLEFTVMHNIIHWATTAVVLGSFFAGEHAAKMVARAVGIVFLAVTLLGVLARDFTGDLLGHGGPLPWSYNIVHAATALFALLAGFAPERRTVVEDRETVSVARH